MASRYLPTTDTDRTRKLLLKEPGPMKSIAANLCQATVLIDLANRTKATLHGQRDPFCRLNWPHFITQHLRRLGRIPQTRRHWQRVGNFLAPGACACTSEWAATLGISRFLTLLQDDQRLRNPSLHTSP